jgi:hypothetical protein
MTPIKDGDYLPYKKAILPDVPCAAMPYPRSSGYRASETTSNGPMPLTGRPIAHETNANFGKEGSARALRQRIVGNSVKVDEQALQPIPDVTRHKRRELT